MVAARREGTTRRRRERARHLAWNGDQLRTPARRDMHWAALGAAAFFALCAIAFAAAAVLAPPLNHDAAARAGVK